MPKLRGQEQLDNIFGVAKDFTEQKQRENAALQRQQLEAQQMAQMQAQKMQEIAKQSELERLFKGDQEEKDRQLKKELVEMQLRALIGKPEKLPAEQVKRNDLIKENQVRAERLKQLYKETPAWKQTVSRIPGLGSFIGQFDPQVRDLQGDETAIAQNETFIKSGAQAPESEFGRMKSSTLPGVFASPEEKAKVLDYSMNARSGVQPSPQQSPIDPKMQRYLELKKKYGK